MNYHEMEMRAVYAGTLNDLMDETPHVVCLEADLGKSSGTVPEVREKHPDNFIECGVCEANMIGIAAGLAKEGKIPFCASFTSFASRRAYDQVSISVGFAHIINLDFMVACLSVGYPFSPKDTIRATNKRMVDENTATAILLFFISCSISIDFKSFLSMNCRAKMPMNSATSV